MLNKLIIAFSSIATASLACFLLFFQFFQQDEWHGFGIILSQGTHYITLNRSIPELLLGDRVGARLLTFGLFNIFHLNPLPYGFIALTLHLANTFLVFILARKLTNKKSIALLSALFFIVNEVGNEAYAWFGTMSGSAVSVLFFLISAYFFLRFIDTNKVKFAVVSAFILWVSFLFKEIAVFAFVFYPVLFYLYSPKKLSPLKFIKAYSPFLIIATVFLLYFAKTVLFIPGDQANYVGANDSFVPTLLAHIGQYPLEGMVQTFIPNFFLFMLSPIITMIFGFHIPKDSLEFLVASQGQYAELTTVLILISAVAMIFFVLRKRWNKVSLLFKKTLISSLLLTALSFIPYIVLNRSFAYLDSRHYYIATIGASIFLATLLFTLYPLVKRKRQIIVLFMGAMYLIIHSTTLFMDFKLLGERSYERRLFLKQTRQLVPNLSEKTVFFITGDYVGYYGLPELKVPFQSGLGHVLMVVYATDEQLNSNFFKEETLIKAQDVGFLYDILGQGYRETNGQGFGYYLDRTELQKALDKKLFTKENIISLYYESEKKRLIKKNNEF
ncbi:MAG: hypothetical protein WD992_03050 [Candidatus Levyibacteriota bacterium]